MANTSVSSGVAGGWDVDGRSAGARRRADVPGPTVRDVKGSGVLERPGVRRARRLAARSSRRGRAAPSLLDVEHVERLRADRVTTCAERTASSSAGQRAADQVHAHPAGRRCAPRGPWPRCDASWRTGPTAAATRRGRAPPRPAGSTARPTTASSRGRRIAGSTCALGDLPLRHRRRPSDGPGPCRADRWLAAGERPGHVGHQPDPVGSGHRERASRPVRAPAPEVRRVTGGRLGHLDAVVLGAGRAAAPRPGAARTRRPSAVMRPARQAVQALGRWPGRRPP